MNLNNGRVNLNTDNNFNILNCNNNNYINNNINTITDKNIYKNVSSLYFSDYNINILQFGIKNKVYNETNGLYNIGRQHDNELKIIMRSIYYQYSKNNNIKIIEQVKELNKMVIDWSVKEIITNIKQYEKYKNDITNLPIPLELSQLSTQKGLNSLEFKSFI